MFLQVVLASLAVASLAALGRGVRRKNDRLHGPGRDVWQAVVTVSAPSRHVLVKSVARVWPGGQMRIELTLDGMRRLVAWVEDGMVRAVDEAGRIVDVPGWLEGVVRRNWRDASASARLAAA